MSGTWREALQALTVPPGQPGSGRQRYGAAMTLWRDGLIPPDVLEVYRIASPLDGQDPAPMLAEAGLPQPGSEIAALVRAAAARIAACAGPGIAEVLDGLARARPAAPEPGPSPVVAAHLATALSAMGEDAVTPAIRAAAPWLCWTTYDLYSPAEIGATFSTGHAFAPLAHGNEFELGLFLIAPGVFYRDRAHAAAELYLPLTGPHLWRFSPGALLETRPAGEPVWNLPHQPHATRVGAVPFLGFYAWTRDIDEAAYVLPSPDWAEIEGKP